VKIINVLKNYIYVYDNGKIVKKELTKEKGIITSFLTPNIFLSLTKKFDKTVSKEEMIIDMEKYIFSYPNIDINKEYKIIYLFIQRENKTIVEALLVDNEDLNNEFKEIKALYKYIDFISPSFLAWQEYYNVTKTDYKNDVFVYFDEDEAYLSVFSDGKYLYHKSLNKLSNLSKITNKKTGELITILKEKGLDRNKYENEELFFQIDKFFSEFFLKIFNQLNYSINEYEIPKYERIFFYSPFKINYLFEQYTNYWNLNGIEFKSVVLKTEYNYLEYLITVFNAKNYLNSDINFSIFTRPPSFIKTPAGMLITYSFVLFMICILFLGKNFYDINNLNKEILILTGKYRLFQKRNSKNLVLLKELKIKISLLNKQYNLVKKQINTISQKVNILTEKNKMPLIYNVLAKITQFLKQYDLKIKKIQKTNNKYILKIVSTFDNTHEVAEFMQKLINSGFKNITSKTIKVNKNKYISYVEFEYE